MTAQSYRGELAQNASLAKYTSWKIGGPAKQLFLPADREDLLQFMADLPADEPLLWLGLGSNLLIRDGGFPGTVILTQGRVKSLEARDGQRIYAEAGVSCGKIARFAAKNELGGAEFFSGIPGTFGGALAMNAGAFGGETWNSVESVELVDRKGEVQSLQATEFETDYRWVRLPAEHWFLSATLLLKDGDGNASREMIRDFLNLRATTQPTNQPSCGSVFRNPEGQHAAVLIEAAGLKGYRVGGAQVSNKHANFIVNLGDASAADVEAVILHVAEAVVREHGVLLEPEVRIVGNKGDTQL